jgi:hypothetical protein
MYCGVNFGGSPQKNSRPHASNKRNIQHSNLARSACVWYAVFRVVHVLIGYLACFKCIFLPLFLLFVKLIESHIVKERIRNILVLQVVIESCVQQGLSILHSINENKGLSFLCIVVIAQLTFGRR